MTEDTQFSLAALEERAVDEGTVETDLGSVFAGVHELARLVDSTSLTRLKIGVGAIQVEIEAEPPAGSAPAPVAGPASVAGSAPVAGPGAEPAPAEPDRGITVKAMLVGVFYRSPEPGAEPFVEVGATVEAGQQIAIVEAMKMMNPVVADQAGVITEILADNGEVVEFDQPLLRLDPS
ncbi:MAG: acetyl-CoA carboxylase, biotin carboxyl carrier protein [Nocardiopsaceae bacterium]|nr:acetyl-CoA carboxylase, biotin carboxyl carrier protein [Nocardiopsaceae bacterium]